MEQKRTNHVNYDLRNITLIENQEQKMSSVNLV